MHFPLKSQRYAAVAAVGKKSSARAPFLYSHVIRKHETNEIKNGKKKTRPGTTTTYRNNTRTSLKKIIIWKKEKNKKKPTNKRERRIKNNIMERNLKSSACIVPACVWSKLFFATNKLISVNRRVQKKIPVKFYKYTSRCLSR